MIFPTVNKYLNPKKDYLLQLGNSLGGRANKNESKLWLSFIMNIELHRWRGLGYNKRQFSIIARPTLKSLVEDASLTFVFFCISI